MDSETFQRHSLTLESGHGCSGEASLWARTLAEGAGLDEERTFAIDLCVVELVTNIVDHGYGGIPGDIRIELAIGRDAAILVLRDDARAFDPLSVPAPAKPVTLEAATVGGRGILLVRSVSGRCTYERHGGENVLTVYFGQA
jgi:anti-sigma regulatory factor (Ser/Thr protein kinase)